MSVPSPLLTHLRVCRCSYSRPATLTRSLRCAAAPNSQAARAPLAPPHADPMADPRIGSPPRAPQYLTCGNVSAPVGLEPAYNSCRLRTPGLPRRCACTRRRWALAGLSSSSSSSSAASSSSSSAATEPLILRLSVPVGQRKPVRAVARLPRQATDAADLGFVLSHVRPEHGRRYAHVAREFGSTALVCATCCQRPGTRCTCLWWSERAERPVSGAVVSASLVRYGFMC